MWVTTWERAVLDDGWERDIQTVEASNSAIVRQWVSSASIIMDNRVAVNVLDADKSIIYIELHRNISGRSTLAL